MILMGGRRSVVKAAHSLRYRVRDEVSRRRAQVCSELLEEQRRSTAPGEVGEEEEEDEMSLIVEIATWQLPLTVMTTHRPTPYFWQSDLTHFDPQADGAGVWAAGGSCTPRIVPVPVR